MEAEQPLILLLVSVISAVGFLWHLTLDNTLCLQQYSAASPHSPSLLINHWSIQQHTLSPHATCSLYLVHRLLVLHTCDSWGAKERTFSSPQLLPAQCPQGEPPSSCWLGCLESISSICKALFQRAVAFATWEKQKALGFLHLTLMSALQRRYY